MNKMKIKGRKKLSEASRAEELAVKFARKLAKKPGCSMDFHRNNQPFKELIKELIS